ncbi:MerR family transcriptional regulator [Epidermidibacterium keratini]|uniref:MerR family transcriptional regulator n=1 Tax=Epidermidibacterium keratini TaxID=1891644 RepID=A0A7L4YN56_9ACTN|nr:MerR family transcriptional regulator [Epidermidibacterium keratini]QHC00284.1 MerR family transcriptional regulator [Epidermidibacterium keratini]
MQWSIQQLAKAAGTTSRTLRHYGERGLLVPAGTGPGGMRMYDEQALPRLLRILMLRQYGVGLDAIAQILAEHTSDAEALRGHLRDLHGQRDRLSAQISSLEGTITAIEEGKPLMAEEVFADFDHTQYREEVEQRWGTQAYADGDRWWRSLSYEQKKQFLQEHRDIATDYAAQAEAGVPADSEQTQDIARRHLAWLSNSTTPTRDYVMGLGELYVADPRFGSNYHGHAEYVRDAMKVYAERNL